MAPHLELPVSQIDLSLIHSICLLNSGGQYKDNVIWDLPFWNSKSRVGEEAQIHGTVLQGTSVAIATLNTEKACNQIFSIKIFTYLAVLGKNLLLFEVRFFLQSGISYAY